jgi:hypothetical protein
MWDTPILPLKRMLHEDYGRKVSVEKEAPALVPQGVWRKDELIGGKPPVVVSSVSGVESSRAGSQLGSCNETGDGQRGREAVNTEVASTALGALSRRGLVKTQQTEKNYQVP